MDSSLDDSAAARTPALPSGDDLSAIAWVQEELRRSLDAAHKSLRRFIKDLEAVTGSDLDSVDPGVLRAARAQIHQGVGALELVGLPAAAVVLRASESAVQKSIAKPQSLTPELVADIERSSFALLDYLARILAGKNVSLAVAVPAVPRGPGSGRGGAGASGRPVGDRLALARDRERSERRAAHGRRRLPRARWKRICCS